MLMNIGELEKVGAALVDGTPNVSIPHFMAMEETGWNFLFFANRLCFPTTENEALVVTFGSSLFISWNKCCRAKINCVHRIGVWKDTDAQGVLGVGSVGYQWPGDHPIQSYLPLPITCLGSRYKYDVALPSKRALSY